MKKLDHADKFQFDYTDKRWLDLKYLRAFEERNRCQICRTRCDVAKLVGHHEKPVHTHPELALVSTNIVILCDSCHASVHMVARYALAQRLVASLILAERERPGRASGNVPMQLGFSLNEPAANDLFTALEASAPAVAAAAASGPVEPAP